MSPKHLFIIAGEASGDRLGAELMAGLKTLEAEPPVFTGVGGPLMQAEGLQSLFPMDELAVMGIVEIIPKLAGLLRRISQTSASVISARPDALITIDSPDFCLRVARKARRHLPDLPTIHFVAPSVWAWRPKRAIKMAKHIDHVLALLPFEPPFMTAAGMTCDFVGHPVVNVPKVSPAEIDAFLKIHGVQPDQKLICLLPGSRRGEIARLGPIFRDVAEQLFDQMPELRFVIPTVAARSQAIAELFRDSNISPIILDPSLLSSSENEVQKSTAFAASYMALAASGTVAVEIAAQGTPMVIAYDGNPLTRAVVKRTALIDTATLVNIVTDSRVIPECLMEDCTPAHILGVVQNLLQDEAAQLLQRETCEKAMTLMGRGGKAPGLRAAASVLSVLDR